MRDAGVSHRHLKVILVYLRCSYIKSPHPTVHAADDHLISGGRNANGGGAVLTALDGLDWEPVSGAHVPGADCLHARSVRGKFVTDVFGL